MAQQQQTASTGYQDAAWPPFEDPVRLDPVIVQRTRDENTITVPWLGGGWQVNYPINGLPRAQLDVLVHEGLLVNIGTPEQPDLRGLHEVAYDDDLFTLRTVRQDPETDYLIFQGYVARRHFLGQAGRSARLSLVHLASDAECIAIGGQMRLSLGAVEALAKDPEAKVLPAGYAGLMAVFNPAGKGNCREKLIEIEGDPNPDNYIPDMKVPLFEDYRKEISQSWSWLRVLVYLAAAAHLVDAAKPCPFTLHQFRFWNLWELATDELLAIDPDMLGPMPPEDPWERALLGKPKDHVISGLSWPDAWGHTCSRAGLGYVWEARWVEDCEAFRWGIRLFVPGSAGGAGQPNFPRMCDLRLPSPKFRIDNKTWKQIREKANVIGFALEEGYAEVVNRCAVHGAAYEYEVTTELVPGWKLDDWWDVDPQDPNKVTEAKDRVRMPQWEAKYVRGPAGTAFNAGDNWLVGRMWGLNTLGFWDGYGRPWPGHAYYKGDPQAYPPVRDRYALFDLADVEAHEVQKNEPGKHFARGVSAVRRRHFQTCFTGRDGDTPLPSKIEICYDWHKPPPPPQPDLNVWCELMADVQVHNRDLRIFIEIEDLRELADKKTGRKFVEAYIEGKLRLRITAVIAGDRAVGDVTMYQSKLSAARRPYFKFLRRPQLVGQRRDDAGQISGGNSQFKESDKPCLARQDMQRAEREAAETAERFDRITWRGTVHLPELVFPYIEQACATGFRPGDLVWSLLAEKEQPKHTLVFQANFKPEYQVIAEVEWHYEQGGDERQGPGVYTGLRIEDSQLIAALGER